MIDTALMQMSGRVAALERQLERQGMVENGLATRGPRPWVDVTAWGVLPENSAATNDANWLALTATLVSGDTILFPRGEYQFSATPTLTGLSYISVFGTSKQAIIHQTTTGQGGIKLTGCTHGTIEQLYFRGPNGTPTDSALNESAVYITGAYNKVINCDMENTWAQCGVNYESGDYGEISRCTMIGKDPNPIIESHCGIRARGNYVTIERNNIRLFSNNLSVSSDASFGNKILGNYLRDGRNTNAYLASCSLGEFSGNILENTINRRGIKIGYTTNGFDLHGNTFINCDILIDYCFGVKFRGNTIDGGAITCNADLNDTQLDVKSAIIEGNTIRNTPYGLDGSQVTGAINGFGSNMLIATNLIENAQGPGIYLYNPAGGGLLGNEIRSNLIRMIGLHDNNTFAAIKVGGGYAENVSGTKIIGNTMTSRARPITVVGTLTSGSNAVTALSVAELDLLEVGDAISGTGIQAGTIISILTATGGLTMSLPATASGSTTITMGSNQMQYGVDSSGAGGGAIEVWGNSVAGAVTGPYNYGACTQLDFHASGLSLGNQMGAAAGQIIQSGSHFINATSNAQQTLGLTISQSGADDEIISLKSSDVAHGMTSITETDTYGAVTKAAATTGGLRFVGLSEASLGVTIDAIETTNDTTKSATATGALYVNATKKSGTTVAAMTANGNIAVFANASSAKFILDADGDSHQDVGTAWTNFHGHDDLELLAAVAANVTRPDDPIRDGFAGFLFERRADLERLRLVTFNDGGTPVVNMSRLTMLLVGAIQQITARLTDIEAQITALPPDGLT